MKVIKQICLGEKIHLQNSMQLNASLDFEILENQEPSDYANQQL